VTGAQFSGVDIDLLADYVGGALDGTPDETVVAGLVADDPAWRDAYDALTGGMASVGAELRLLGAEDEPMPADVVLRLNAALAELSAPSGESVPSVDSVVDEPIAEESVPKRHLVAVPDEVGSEREHPRRRGRARTLRRWAAPVGIAAGVLAFAGIGFGGLLPGDISEDASSTGSAADQPAPMLESDTDARLAGPDTTVISSGVDYSRGTLKEFSARTKRSTDNSALGGASAPSVDATSGQAQVYSATAVPKVLEPLVLRDALLACLAAITTEHGAGTITPDSVDYASFEGTPALVVRFTASDGTWSWVSGPECGTPGAAADTRYQVRVG
jgi:hypothetical protein